MTLKKNQTPLNILSAILTIISILSLSFCSSPASLDQLKQKNGKYYLAGENRPFFGKAISRHQNGRIKAEYNLLAGKLHGRTTFWTALGKKQLEVEYIQGKKKGKSLAWYDSGKKRYEYHFKEGKRDGKSRGWHENGRLKTEADFKEGKLNGKWVIYHENGIKAEEAEYIKDIHHGILVRWYSNGQREFQGNFRMGTYHGYLVSWYRDGNKKFERFFKNGRPEGVWKKWFPDNQPEIQLQFKNGEYDGLLKAWYKNGQQKFLRDARHGRLTGMWKSWYENGTLRNSGVFKDGKLHGKWMEWYKNGNKQAEITYHRGQKREILQWHLSGNQKLNARWNSHSRSWSWNYWDKHGSVRTGKTHPYLMGLYPFFFTRYQKLSPVLNKAQRQTLDSRQKILDFPVYVMNYSGGYALDSFLLNGIQDQELGFRDLRAYKKTDRCSTFMASSQNGETFFAHNWDFKPTEILILFTHPGEGYASVSVVSAPLLGDISDNLHLGIFQKEAAYLRAPFYPMEGMNACGVAVSSMYVPGEMIWNPSQVTLNMYQIMRVVLDYASNIEEAIELFKNYNNSESSSQHFLVADSSGRSAIIEYIDGELKVNENTKTWQVATNSLVSGLTSKSLRHQCRRYDIAHRILEKHHGNISWQQAMQILENISMTGTPETISSTVYNLNTGRLYLAVGRNYEKIFPFTVNKRIMGSKD